MAMDNNFLFKVTGWALLALAWAWFTLEWLPSYANGVQYGWVATALGSDEPIPEPGELHPIVKLAVKSPAYTFLGGVLVVAWTSLLISKLLPRSPAAKPATSC
jgi:hypothetical protein